MLIHYPERCFVHKNGCENWARSYDTDDEPDEEENWQSLVWISKGLFATKS